MVKFLPMDSRVDLADDFSELIYLTTATHKRLSEYAHVLSSQQGAYYPETFEYIRHAAEGLMQSYKTLLQEVGHELEGQKNWSSTDVPRLLHLKRQYADRLRTMQGCVGAVMSGGEWQAPSSDFTVASQGGNRTGHVTHNVNDYTRDQYPAEENYAQIFAREYVDHPLRLPPRTLLTSSCMSALTTVLSYARARMGPEDVVMVGATSYFQNKWVAEHMFPNRVIYVDEFDTADILAKAKHHQPSVVLIESIAATESLAMPNLEELLPALSRVLPEGSCCVIDATTTATMVQPLSYAPLSLRGMEVVTIASLSKYYQFGFDKVTAGVIYAPLSLNSGLAETRRHLGTILPEASLYTLPMPNRQLLDKRLSRIGRNSRVLAEQLDGYTRTCNGPVSHMLYPGLPTYRGYSWAKDTSFHGGIVVFKFKEGYRSAAYQEKFARRLLAEAKKQHVDLVCGAGFGYNTARLYYLSKLIEGPFFKPFVRIALGTETAGELERLIAVCKEVLSSY